MTDRFVTIQQLITDYCPVGKSTVHHWIDHCGLNTYRGSKEPGSQRAKVLIRLSEFFEWMEERQADNEAFEETARPEAKEVVGKLFA